MTRREAGDQLTVPKAFSVENSIPDRIILRRTRCRRRLLFSDFTFLTPDWGALLEDRADMADIGFFTAKEVGQQSGRSLTPE